MLIGIASRLLALDMPCNMFSAVWCEASYRHGCTSELSCRTDKGVSRGCIIYECQEEAQKLGLQTAVDLETKTHTIACDLDTLRHVGEEQQSQTPRDTYTSHGRPCGIVAPYTCLSHTSSDQTYKHRRSHWSGGFDMGSVAFSLLRRPWKDIV